MQKSLLALIRVPVQTPGDNKDAHHKIGTGYPIAPSGFILTAWHVLFPANRDPSRPVTILWYHLAAEHPDRKFRPISDDDIVWHCKELRCALLRCPLPSGATRLFGQLASSGPTQGSSWHSQGFPRAAKKEDGRHPQDFRGTMHSISTDRSPHFTIDVKPAVATDEDWKGASGMPIFLEGTNYIYGIANEFILNIEAQQLNVAPAFALLQSDGFCKNNQGDLPSGELQIDPRYRNLREAVIELLQDAPLLMQELENALLPELDRARAAQRDAPTRARELGLRMLEQIDFTRAIELLFGTQQRLPLPHRDPAVNQTLNDLSKWLLPWLFVRADPDNFHQLAAPSIGYVLKPALGLHCFAAIVTAGLAKGPAKLLGGRDPRGQHAMSARPVARPDEDWSAAFRRELYARLGVLSEFDNEDPATQDGRINERLKHLHERRDSVRWYVTFFVNEEDEIMLAGIAKRYKYLAVMQLDRKYAPKQDSDWLKMSSLMGYAP
jgi:hypothetical protein